MDILQLPSLSGVTPIKQAWSVLKAAQRSAIISTAEDRPVLITAENLALGENRGAKTLAELEARSVPIVVNFPGGPQSAFPEEGVQWAPALDMPSQTGIRTHLRETQLGEVHREIDPDQAIQELIDRMLEGIDINFALVGMSPGAAILVSRYESAMRDHAGPPRRCWCKNPDFVHSYDDKVTGDPCDWDIYTVECRR